MKLLLGIETSCDDTSLAIYDLDHNELKWHKSFSQEFIMAKWGGVVPEIAARNHVEKLTHLFQSALNSNEIQSSDFNYIAVTSLPGLLGPLLTGMNLAKSLSLINQTPIIPVNHLYAHLEAIHLTESIAYPYLGLLVSGGHSSFFIVKSSQNFEYLGGTIDDAAGEAFDKGGKLMGLDYPSGKIIDDLAKDGDKSRYEFPIGLKAQDTCNLSYSGLKTALRVFLDKNPGIEKSNELSNVAASYQEAIVEALNLKTKKALKISGKLPIVVGGGVACNSRLREVLTKNFQDVHFVSAQFCTDNAAMIANYGRLNLDLAITYPQSLELDAQSRYSKSL